MIIDEISSRFGVPVDFAGEDVSARSRYIRQCESLRNQMPAGQHQVAPRVSMSTARGLPIEEGKIVTAADFGENEVGHFRLEALVFGGYVLRSEQQSAAELAEIAAHVQTVRDLNAKFVADTPAAKLDQLLERAAK